MLDWLAIAILLGVGLILVILEVIFVPGTTILGIIGMAMMVVGIFLAFQEYGTAVGWMVLGGASAISLGALVYSLRSGVWDNFALKKSIDSKFNDEFPIDVQVGQIGKALSDLKPIGKGEFNNKVIEVRSYGNFVDSGSAIQVSKVDNTRVFVEPYVEKKQPKSKTEKA